MYVTDVRLLSGGEVIGTIWSFAARIKETLNGGQFRLWPVAVIDYYRLVNSNWRRAAEEHEMGHVFGLGHSKTPYLSDNRIIPHICNRVRLLSI